MQQFRLLTEYPMPPDKEVVDVVLDDYSTLYGCTVTVNPRVVGARDSYDVTYRGAQVTRLFIDGTRQVPTLGTIVQWRTSSSQQVKS